MQTTRFIGADVSKDHIRFATYGDNAAAVVVDNNKAALKAYLKRLPELSLIAMEATNTYHGLLAELAYQAKLSVFVLNPKDVHHYSKGVGCRAKTDRIDALIIARYLAKEHAELLAWTPPTSTQAMLNTLIQRRATLTNARQTLQQSLQDVADLRSMWKSLDRQLANAQKMIDRKIVRCLNQDPELLRMADSLRAIPGVGPLISAALATLFQRLRFTSSDAAVAFTGLDPRPRDSGQFKGRRKLSKRGPGELRRLLYVGAMTTARHPLIKPLYQRELAKGLSATAAYNVIARKLVRTAWSMLNHNRPFELSRFVGALT